MLKQNDLRFLKKWKAELIHMNSVCQVQPGASYTVDGALVGSHHWHQATRQIRVLERVIKQLESSIG